MESWMCEFILTLVTIASTTLFESQLLPIFTLLKSLHCKGLLKCLFRFYRVLLTCQISPRIRRRIHYEDETKERSSFISMRSRKILCRVNGGRLRWRYSKKYLQQVNKTWNDRYFEAIRNKVSVLNVNETAPVGSPGDLLSQCLDQRRVIKWSQTNQVRYFHDDDFVVQSRKIPEIKSSFKSALKRPQKKLKLLQFKPDFPQPVPQESQHSRSCVFIQGIKSVLFNGTQFRNTNEIELGLESTKVPNRRFEPVERSLVMPCTVSRHACALAKKDCFALLESIV